jgi:lysozyme family protein
MNPAPATFEACLAFVWGPGRDGGHADQAPGETFNTVYGVTQATWDHAVAQGLVTGTLAEATRDQCATVLHALFWNALRCSSLPVGVALLVFNAGMMSGTGRAARRLQAVVGAQQDGVIGPQTIGLATSYGTHRLIDALASADEAYLAGLRNASQFLGGWERRVEDARRLAFQMAGIAG